jgi:hypothetical protein
MVDWTELEQAGISSDPLLLRAVQVFGKTQKALSWLNAANADFNGKTPRAAAQTERRESPGARRFVRPGAWLCGLIVASHVQESSFTRNEFRHRSHRRHENSSSRMSVVKSGSNKFGPSRSTRKLFARASRCRRQSFPRPTASANEPSKSGSRVAVSPIQPLVVT